MGIASEVIMHRELKQILSFVLLAVMFSTAQSSKPSSAQAGAEYSGMYNFLRDGEFVQITVEDQGNVTGFISRFGDSESDRKRDRDRA